MATSGTATFNPQLLEIFEEVFERCGLEMRTGYDLTTARRSFNFLMADWANRGLNTWLLDLETLSLTDGTATYNLTADTIDVLDGSLRTNSGNASTQSDLSMNRISMTTYLQLPNKLLEGRPIQYMITRGTSVPTVTFWPIPDATGTYVFAYERLRRVEDAGTTASNTADIPFRFIPALTSGLAWSIASKRREAMALIPQLKQRYDEDLDQAMSEDRERASFMFVPYVGRV